MLLEAHAVGLVGTYDAAVIEKDAEGKVHVHKREKPTQHGAWTGAAVGALVGAIFPAGDHRQRRRRGGRGRHDRALPQGHVAVGLKEIGDLLESGDAALIVIGESKVREELEKELKRAQSISEREVDAEADELKREIDRAAKEGSPA